MAIKRPILSVLMTLSLTAVSCSDSFSGKKPGVPHAPACCKELPHQPTTDFNNAMKLKGAPHQVEVDLPYFETTAKEMESSVYYALDKANSALEQLAMSTKVADLNFASTLGKIDQIYYELGAVWSRISLLQAVTENPAMKQKGDELEVLLSQWEVDAASRKDVYKVIKVYADTNPQLEGEEKKFFDEQMRDYRRMGFDLAESVQDEIKSLKKELADLKQQISSNIATGNKKKIKLSQDEVLGLPESSLEALDQEPDGTYSLRAGIAAQTTQVLDNSPIEAVREKVYRERRSVAKDTNPELMKQVVRKRAKLARLLGYDNWADYKTETRMAGSAQAVLDFENNLVDGLDPKFQAEISELRKLKVEETKNAQAEIKSWDIGYYTRVLQKTKFNVDAEELRKYFEYNQVLKGMFEIFEDLFAIEIKEVTPPYKWTEKLRMIEITDAATKKPMGFLYLDMFPRPETEKYGHFAMFTIRSGKLLENGVYRRPVASLVCNFPEGNGGPSLLSFDNVETLFHEFGHGLHSLLTEAKISSFSGTSVERDFVEAPSQMLEYWLEDKATLDRFAVNYQDPTDKIPEDILNAINAANKATVAIGYRAQLAYGLLDMALHTDIKEGQDFDIIEMTNEILSDVFLAHPDEASFITGFGHLFGGYDAAYYGYAWSDSLAADMASLFESAPGGFADKELGLKLRREVYEKGASRNINETVEAYLGRKPSDKAFLEKLGIDQ